MSNPTTQRQKSVLITGAGSGLGEATAHVFAAAGFAVACLDVRADAAERVSQSLGEHDVPSIALACDVRDDNAVAQAVTTAHDRLASLDVVICAAGIDHTLSVEAMTVAQWDQVLDVNLRAPFLFAKAAMPIMRQQGGGHIINIASTAAVRAWGDTSAYHASKWGLVGLTRALGVEGRPHNIKATTIIAGGMRTHFFDRFVEQGIPLPDPEKLQDPAEVARVMLFAVQMPAGSALQEVIVTPPNETSWP